MVTNVSPYCFPDVVSPIFVRLDFFPPDAQKQRSTTGVYHCTEPVPAEPDWGIAVRVSQEAEDTDRSMSDAGNATSKKRSTTEGGRPAVGKTNKAMEEEQGQGQSDVTTPPLLVPLQSGDAYFLLDDFK